jgi:ABC-2 type transport system permease protein
VTWHHFRALMWLRWRLLVNQIRKGGTVGVVLLAIVAVVVAITGVLTAAGLFLVGLFAVGDGPPIAVLFIWDGLVAAFLMFWMIGLAVELQRAEALSLDKFLHLPVSLRSAFAVNYLSSLVSPCLLFFLPAMFGFAAGLVFSHGPAMLLVVPLLAAFLLAVTALTYQFQGWLAALMTNPRRRRTVIVITTMTIVVLAQFPNLINLVVQRNIPDPTGRPELVARHVQRTADLQRQLEAKTITPEEFHRRQAELKKEFEAEKETAENQQLASMAGTARLFNVVLPPGWLPYGAMTLAEGTPLPALLGTLALGLVGTASLWRAYRTTLRLYTGQIGKKRASPAVSEPERQRGGSEATLAGARALISAPTNLRLVERRLPWVSEQAAAIALAGFRGLTRAPEAKMMLLSPVIMLIVFGSMFLTRPAAPSAVARPWLATGVIAMVMLGMSQLMGNQFGFDRSGFRVFVLCSARRGEILLGKNLSFAPLALGLAAVGLVLFEILYPMRVDLFLAAVIQAVTMFLLYSLASNLLSIFAPLPIAAGSLRPANTRMVPILIHLAFTFLLPLVWSPALLPLAVDSFLEWATWRHGLPVGLLLSLAACAGVVAIYRPVLAWQGALLQAREQSILETVTSKSE